jgi:hypothetical protein
MRRGRPLGLYTPHGGTDTVRHAEDEADDGERLEERRKETERCGVSFLAPWNNSHR